MARGTVNEKHNLEIYDKAWIERENFYDTQPGRLLITFLIEKCLASVTSINSILDVGCGNGSLTAYLSLKFPNSSVTGIDFSANGIKRATTRFAANESTNNKKLTFQCIEAESDEIWDKHYDMITTFEVLEHVEDWECVLERICASANKYVLISTPHGKMHQMEAEFDGHVRNFKHGQLEFFMSQRGFKPANIFYAGFPFLNPIGISILYGSRKFRVAYDNKKINDPPDKQSFLSKILWILFRYFSTKRHFGRQFVGLFERVE